MRSEAASVPVYFDQLPDERKSAMLQLREAILSTLPKGFAEVMNYGMVSYVVPHSLFPAGYHCDPALPLPFISIASQKNFIALYHMGIYADPVLLEWFTAEYKKRVPSKLDMGKSCIRFKKPEQIPFDLVAELVSRMSVKDWVSLYQKNLQASKK